MAECSLEREEESDRHQRFFVKKNWVHIPQIGTFWVEPVKGLEVEARKVPQYLELTGATPPPHWADEAGIS